MKNRIISLVLTLILIVSAFVGCNPKPAVVNKPVNKQERKPQLVVAMNPILAYQNGTNKIAFNDVKNAMSTDQNAASLTALADNTDLVWVYKQGADWKKRGIYGLEKWRNGEFVSSDKLHSTMLSAFCVSFALSILMLFVTACAGNSANSSFKASSNTHPPSDKSAIVTGS